VKTKLAAGASTAAEPQAAARLVIGAVPSWWERRAAEAGLSKEWCNWRRALSLPPFEFDTASSELAAADPYGLGEAYACALASRDRLLHGCHYTPRPLASALWRELQAAGATTDGGITDPAAGAGALLLRPVRDFVQYWGGDPKDGLAEAKRRFGGTDLDPHAVWLGNAILGAELLPLWAKLPADKRRPLPRLLEVADALGGAQAPATTLIMNPPFGRVRLDSEERARWRRSLYGHANRYALFLHAAVEMTEPGGVIGAVLPTSFLGGAYYQRLRAFLAEEAPLVRLVMVGERAGVFASGVLQETCLAVFRRAERPSRVVCSMQSVNGRVINQLIGRAPLPRRPELPWLLPRTSTDAPLVRRASRFRKRLPEYGWKASTGPLVWNRHKPQIDGDPTDGATPILWAADVAEGGVGRSAAREHQRWIRLRPRDDFMRLAEPAVLVQRTTAPEQPRRLVAAVLDEETLKEWGGAVVVENHVNVLRCSDPDSPVTPELLAALLNTPTFDRLYRCMTGTVAVSAYELEALPLPAPAVLSDWRDLSRHELLSAVAAAFS
jgi:adenine-specific DNA-methyltransferase